MLLLAADRVHATGTAEFELGTTDSQRVACTAKRWTQRAGSHSMLEPVLVHQYSQPSNSSASRYEELYSEILRRLFQTLEAIDGHPNA